MKHLIMTCVLCASAMSTTMAQQSQQQLPLYLDQSKPMEQRIDDAIARMTLQEKIRIIHAQSKFSSAGVPRLGFPDFWTDDGPHGVRPDVLWDEWEQAGQTNDSCVAFPALTCLAASWNPQMSRIYGEALGEEALYRGKDMILGPGVNIYRTPLNGRNFEYMGEDPYLASIMVVPYIQGLQSKGVSACVKHYCLNNDEEYRHLVNVKVSDRALHEIYLPAFKAAVEKGKTWAIMGAYNLYKDEHNCHNQWTLNKILKGDWKFDGVVVSDWGGAHDTDQSVKNGLDMEFGSWTNGLSWGASNAYDNYYLATPKVRIRGTGTINNSDPLYIVDGMPIEGGLDYLNPSDIESIEVLKDAASGAIYGARAANGVILVTTKKGKIGKAQINYNFSYGWQSAWKKRDVTSATDYAILQNERAVNGGQAPIYADPYKLIDSNGNAINGFHIFGYYFCIR
jgi:TonB-dependent SusC/RagA subfamily outer membrane receptor